MNIIETMLDQMNFVKNMIADRKSRFVFYFIEGWMKSLLDGKVTSYNPYEASSGARINLHHISCTCIHVVASMDDRSGKVFPISIVNGREEIWKTNMLDQNGCWREEDKVLAEIPNKLSMFRTNAKKAFASARLAFRAGTIIF